MNIGIALPNAGEFKPETVQTFGLMCWYQGAKGYNLSLIPARGPCIDENRNFAIAQAQQFSCDWLLYLDTDMEYLGNGDAIGEMIALGKDVVTGVAYQGMYPYRPVIYDFEKDQSITNWRDIPTSAFQVDAGGGAFLLISRKVINGLLKPGVIERLGRPFDLVFEGRTLKMREDTAFYWRLRELGIETWALPCIPIAHIKKFKVVAKHFEAAKEQIDLARPK
jgi:hypothetical protein